MKRSQTIPAVYQLERDERAYVCEQIATDLRRKMRAALHQKALVEASQTRARLRSLGLTAAVYTEQVPDADLLQSPLLDCLDAASASGRRTPEADLVFNQWVRLRTEWDTPTRKDCRDARKVCLQMLEILCPEAHALLLAVEQESKAPPLPEVST